MVLHRFVSLLLGALICALIAVGATEGPAHAADTNIVVAQATISISEKEAFDGAKELGTIEAWEAFLNNFPKGFRADLARAYVKRLGAERSATPAPPQAAPPPAAAPLQPIVQTPAPPPVQVPQPLARPPPPPPPAPEPVPPESDPSPIELKTAAPPPPQVARDDPRPVTEGAEENANTQPLPPLGNEEGEQFLRRGKLLLESGDIAAARLVFEYAALLRSAEAMFALGETYDPEKLASWGVIGIQPDLGAAHNWYAQAAELGHEAADARAHELKPLIKR